VTTNDRPLRLLFFLRAVNFDRVFECLLRELLGRGHSVDVVFDTEKGGLPENPTALFDALRAEYPALSYEDLPKRREWWLPGATAIRLAIDYVRYLEPAFAHATALRERARSRLPAPMRLALGGVARNERLRSITVRLLWTLEGALPVSGHLRRFIRERRPDAVLASPLVGLGSHQGDYLRAASAEGIPTVLPVASWDNLTNKGVVRERPTVTIVWNEKQIEEAVTLHGLDPDRVVAVGAHTWDHWFDWQPSTTAAEFAAKVGLTPGRPFVLYVGSSSFIAGAEVGFIRDWLRALRTSEHQKLRELGVVIRPHPQNVKFWETEDVDEPGSTVLYPRGGAAPTDAERKADYYDSLFHSRAIVGINTSALAESSIVRKPALTILDPRFRGSQEGTLHFAHIAAGDGNLLLAADFGEHVAQLLDVLESPERYAERIDRFLHTFVRPQGLDRPAAGLAADHVEQAAATRPEPLRRPSLARRSAALVFAALVRLGGPRRLWRPGGLRRFRPA
jgi:hypothetical protein